LDVYEQGRTMLDTTLERFTRKGSVNSPASNADELRGPQRMGPVAQTDFEHALVEAVGRALRATGYPELRHLQIEIERGTVMLWGRVSTYHQKQLAQATAQRVDGVRGIANGIEVDCCR